MANTSIGGFFMELFLVDKLTAPLKNIANLTQDTTDKLSKTSSSFMKLGVSIGGAGLALQNAAPGFEEFGRLLTGIGAGFGGLAAAAEAPGAMLGFAQSLQEVQRSMTAAKAGYASYNAMLVGTGQAATLAQAGTLAASTGVTTLGGAFGFLQAMMAPLLPIILAIAAVAFVLYTVWSENFGGIQQIVMGAFGDISNFVFDVIEFMKGVIIGFFEATKPVWMILGLIIKGVGMAFRLVSERLREMGGAFNFGRKMVYLMMPALLILKGVMFILTPLFRLLGNAIEKAGGAGTVIKKAFMWLTPLGWIIRGLMKLWDMFGDSITAAFEKVWEAIQPLFEPIMKLIDGVKKLIDWYQDLGKTEDELAAERGGLGAGLGYEGLGEGPGMGIYGAVPKEAIPTAGSSSVDARQISVSAEVNTGPVSNSVDVDMMANLIARRQKAELESIP